MMDGFDDEPTGRDDRERLEQRKATFTYDEYYGQRCYYFAPLTRTPGELTQRHVKAIVDIAPDGTLAGVELIDDMPPLTQTSP